jgi:hypothetical protein
MRAASPTTSWLISPKADILFIANATWPLFALLLWLNKYAWHMDIDLYLMFVIGTPHRWVTLPLVGMDKERLKSNWPTLAFVGVATTAAFFAILGRTHDIRLMILLAYLWNLWHVAAQNAGVVRIYGINGQPEKRASGTLEKWLLRTFMLYAFLRVGSLGVDYQNSIPLVGYITRFSVHAGTYDWFSLLIPIFLFIREARGYDPRLHPKYIHLSSVLLNYSAMIVLCHLHKPGLVLAVAASNALFHATEYYGILTWMVSRRADPGKAWFLPGLLKHWTVTLIVFLYGMAALSYVLVMRFTYFWMVANTLVACLHYAYDGVIWKMPAVFKRAPAAAPAGLAAAA